MDRETLILKAVLETERAERGLQKWRKRLVDAGHVDKAAPIAVALLELQLLRLTLIDSPMLRPACEQDRT